MANFRCLIFILLFCLVYVKSQNEVPRPPQADCLADIVFVVDDSRSIGAGNFDRMKLFLSQLVSGLDIDSGNTRVGLVTFSSSVGTVFNLRDHSRVASLQSAISSLRYTGGGTDTARALAYVRTTMLTSAAGDRSDVPNIIVVVTDGISVNSQATVMEANNLKSITVAGIRTTVVSVGIGRGIDLNELNNMASAPRDRNVILVYNFSRLTDVEQQLRNVITCNVVVPTVAPNPSPLPPAVVCPVDIIFVVDESGSINSENFAMTKSFLSRLVSTLDVDSGNTRVGLVTFSSNVGTVFDLTDHSSVASLQSAISSLVYRAGSTNTSKALAYVRTTMLTSEAGVRTNSSNIVAVLTDGNSNNFNATVTEAEKLKRVTVGGSQTKVVALGIGSEIDVYELNRMASAPSDRNVILVHNFSSLADVEIKFHVASCNVVVPTIVPDTLPGDCPADIIFVLDEYENISSQNVTSMKSYLIQLVSGLDIDSGNTRVGLVTFSSSVGTVFNLKDHSSVASLQSAISSLNYTGGGTDTARALAYVRTTMLTSATGDRPNIPNIVAFLTDGNWDNNTAAVTEVEKLKRVISGGSLTQVLALDIGSGVDQNALQLRNATCDVIPPPPVDCAVDVIFAIDESESICASNFLKVKSFLRQVVSRLDVDPCKTRVGIVTFSSNIGTVVNLSNYTSVASLQSAISSLGCRGDGTVNTAKALDYVRTTMLTPEAGDRVDIPNTVVVVTDGNSDDFNATVTEAEKLKGVTAAGSRTKVVTLGIGSELDLNELNITASAPRNRNFILAHNFSRLRDAEERLINAICSDYLKGWTYLQSAQKYYRAIFELMDWKKADMRCRELGSHSRLVDINDQTENTAVKQFIASFHERQSRICVGPDIFGLPGYQGYWTSGQRSNSSSCGTPWVWKTFAGSYKNVSYTDWHASEPNCAGDEETCLQLTTTKYLGQLWADINCRWVLCPLCELDM